MTEYVVNGDTVLLAIRNWDKVMNNNRNYLSANQFKGPYRFSTFIGPHELVPGHYIESRGHHTTWGWKVTQLAYNKIQMLASPHHYALLKAFKAKTGWQGKIP